MSLSITVKHCCSFVLLALFLVFLSIECLAMSLEEEVLSRINQARSDISGEAVNLGMNLEAMNESVGPDIMSIPDSGLALLALNPILSMAAQAHVDDMKSRLYYSVVSPDGLTVEDLARDFDYQPALVTENLGALAFVTFISSTEAVGFMLDKIISDALQSFSRGEDPSLFDTVFRDVGVGLAGFQWEFDGTVYNIYVMSVVFGLSAEDTGCYGVVGYIYHDFDANGRYTPGEGLGGIHIILKPDMTFGPYAPIEIVSAPDGRFVFRGIGNYKVFIQGVNRGSMDLGSRPLRMDYPMIWADIAAD